MAEFIQDENRFVDAAACGDLDEVKELLGDTNYKAELINKVDKDGRSAFHYSCLNDDCPLLRVLLADPRVDVQLQSPRGETAMHMAALYAAQEALKLLFVDGRLSPDSRNKFGETPLHLCAGSGDKGAAKTAKLLLQHGASMKIADQWKRGPYDVSCENAENQLVKVFDEYLASHPDIRAEVDIVSAAHREEAERPVYTDAANRAAKGAIFGMLGGVKLRKTVVVEKTMFNSAEGSTTKRGSGHDAAAAAPKDGRRALSKLVDFPGDVEEIKRHLADSAKVDPAGRDAYGLAAVHKFASWNKVELLTLLIACLSKEELGAQDPEGKTALHWAVEMASVGAVKVLVAAGIDVETKNKKGRSVRMILDSVEHSSVIERLKNALVVVG